MLLPHSRFPPLLAPRSPKRVGRGRCQCTARSMERFYSVARFLLTGGRGTHRAVMCGTSLFPECDRIQSRLIHMAHFLAISYFGQSAFLLDRSKTMRDTS
ncbi:hypothetical protein BV22DRAFT_920533 [Leucogyrophana mollusca]|uniref:Uncharacterized protein n=1 Tax=Leucogyrophana mollusca TaxID=85980 RepID=A0ACB8AWU6_9AGAM|nr:hypothetical protein BV22DRAFT_920533 [Leucogyrophana mollusca]